MLFFRHPKPVVDNRAVAMMVVQQRITKVMPTHVLIVPARKGAEAEAPRAKDEPADTQAS